MITSFQGNWFAYIFIALIVVATIFEQRSPGLLSYVRGAGELHWWQLLTAHLAYNKMISAVFGIIALKAVIVVFKDDLSTFGWLILTTTLMFAVGASIHWFMPNIEHYAGVSGVLHGLGATVAILGWRRGEHFYFPEFPDDMPEESREQLNKLKAWFERHLHQVLLAAIGLKIAIEFIMKFGFEYQPMVNGDYVPEANLVGLIAGVLIGFIWPIDNDARVKLV